MTLKNRGEANFMTSSIGQIAYLLWKGIRPDDVTFKPDTACLYFNDAIDFGEIMSNYWTGDKIPGCELGECIVTAQRILNNGDILKEWFDELEEALNDLREDYFPIYVKK